VPSSPAHPLYVAIKQLTAEGVLEATAEFAHRANSRRLEAGGDAYPNADRREAPRDGGGRTGGDIRETRQRVTA
jgi:hypothetical protein